MKNQPDSIALFLLLLTTFLIGGCAIPGFSPWETRNHLTEAGNGGYVNWSELSGVSNNGNYACGTISANGRLLGARLFFDYFGQEQKTEVLNDPCGNVTNTYAVDVLNNGTVVGRADIDGEEHPVIWHDPFNPFSLFDLVGGGFLGEAVGGSEDGTIIIGTVAKGFNPPSGYRLNRTTENVIYFNDLIPGNVYSFVSSCSVDGDVVGGEYADQGQDDQPFLWRASSGISYPDLPDEATVARIRSISPDGEKAAGVWFDNTNQSFPCLWDTETGEITLLPVPDQYAGGRAATVSNSSTVVYGELDNVPVKWENQTNVIPFIDVLKNGGADSSITDFDIFDASGDTTTVVGRGVTPGAQQYGWSAHQVLLSPDDCPYNIAADFNNDCRIDLLDLENFVRNFLLDVGQHPAAEVTDFNGDEVTNLLDFTSMTQAWGIDCLAEPRECAFYDCPGCRAGEPGFEFMEITDGTLRVDVAEDFFGAGSSPLELIIPVTGDPIGPRGPFELGHTSLVAELTEPYQVPINYPTHQEVAIEIVEMSLTSIDPVEVKVNGSPTLWDVEVTLEPDTTPATPGVLMATPTGPASVDVQAQIPVNLLVEFTSETDTHSLTLPDVLLMADNPAVALSNNCRTSELGADLIRATKLCFSGSVLSDPLDFDFQSASPDDDRPGPVISPNANVSDAVVSIGRNTQIGDYSNIGDGCIIGANCTIGHYCQIGANVIIGSNVHISDNTTIYDNCYVGSGTFFGEGCGIANDVIIGTNCTLNDSVVIQQNSTVGDRCQLGFNARLSINCTLGQDVGLGDNAYLVSGIDLVAGAQIAASEYVSQDLVRCIEDMNTFTITTRSQCRASGYAVWGRIPLADDFGRRVMNIVSEQETIDPADLPAELQDLQDDVNDAGSGDPDGAITDRTYVDDTYDCDDFAGDMEKELQDKGYDATFTLMWRQVPNPDYHWYNSYWTPRTRWVDGHAVVDIRKDDKTLWLEPQTGKLGLDLDFDNDGKVEFDTKYGDDLTDNSWRIEVYNNRADAEAAGHVLD